MLFSHFGLAGRPEPGFFNARAHFGGLPGQRFCSACTEELEP